MYYNEGPVLSAKYIYRFIVDQKQHSYPRYSYLPKLNFIRDLELSVQMKYLPLTHSIWPRLEG